MENKQQYYISLVMLGCLFFIFGLVSWVNSILIPYFKIACELKSGVQTYLVTFAFYIAYLVMTVPASFLLRRTGYKKGTMCISLKKVDSQQRVNNGVFTHQETVQLL